MPRLRRTNRLAITLAVLASSSVSTLYALQCQQPTGKGGQGFRPDTTVIYDFTGSVAENRKECIEAAFSAWTTANQSSGGSGVTFVKRTESQTSSVTVRMQLISNPAGTDPSRDSQGYVTGGVITLTTSLFVLESCEGFTKAVLHELGHLQNLNDLQGSNGSSVMNQFGGKDDAGGNIPLTPTSCDKTAAQQETIRRDDDADGWSPDDEFPDMDCDGTTSGEPGDNNSNVYPGAEDTSPVCDAYAEQQMLPTGYDYNCDGEDDAEQAPEVCPSSPIVIDVLGNGFALTNRADGVLFDLDSDLRTERIPWTAAGGDDAWLVLDRNGNGRIDNGRELFGNFTPQPPAPFKNGFLALAVFDQNGDLWIDVGDAIFNDLRLWIDQDHDGVSAPGELKGLSEVGITRMSLDYRELLRRDGHGNWFRFGARVIDRRARDVGPMAFDVFFDYPAGRLPPGPSKRGSQSRR